MVSRNYDAILDQFGPFGDGIAGGKDDGVGVIANGSGEVILPADFDCFVHRRSQPRHYRFLFAFFSSSESQSSIFNFSIF